MLSKWFTIISYLHTSFSRLKFSHFLKSHHWNWFCSTAKYLGVLIAWASLHIWFVYSLTWICIRMRFAICTQMLRFKCFIKLSAGLILDDICYCVLTTLFDLQKKHCNKCERKTFYKFSTLVVSSLYAHMMCVLVCFASFFFVLNKRNCFWSSALNRPENLIISFTKQ